MEHITALLADTAMVLDVGNVADPLAILQEVQLEIAEFRAACAGLHFAGTGDAVIGPVKFPDGLYVVHFSGGELDAATINSASGECDAAYVISEGAYTEEGAFLRGCGGLIAIRAEGDWKLTFDNIQPLDPVVVIEGSTLQYGSTVDGFLFANSAVEYFFTGTVGDQITIGAIRQTGDADLLLELYAPDGEFMFSDDDSHPEDFLNPQIANLPLPISGQYRILVTRCDFSFCNAAASATFRLTLLRQEYENE